MASNPLGKEPKYKLTGNKKEQGTPVSGYEEKGPYHCEDCIHRIGGAKSDLPFCIHPVVLSDPKMKKWRTQYEGQNAVKINMERGCCAYVNQEGHEDEEDEE